MVVHPRTNQAQHRSRPMHYCYAGHHKVCKMQTLCRISLLRNIISRSRSNLSVHCNTYTASMLVTNTSMWFISVHLTVSDHAIATADLSACLSVCHMSVHCNTYTASMLVPNTSMWFNSMHLTVSDHAIATADLSVCLSHVCAL